MSSSVTGSVFGEPRGRRNAAVMFAGTLSFSLFYAYSVATGDAASAAWLLFMVAGSGLAGVAESLPQDRRRAAGVLRMAGIAVLAALVAAVVVAPELVTGPR